jgi:hypothetical protein
MRPKSIAITLFVSILTLPRPAAAQFGKWAIDVAAGGGFVGLNTNEVQTTPRTTCTTADPPVCTVDTNNVVITANSRYGWQPAVATGLVFRFVPKAETVSKSTSGEELKDGIGFGIGGQFVFVPRGDTTRAAPALTIHVGKSSQQIFFGWLFSPVDRVEIPGGGTSAVVPAAFPTSSLLRPDSQRRAQFFAGVVIGGVPVTRPQ